MKTDFAFGGSELRLEHFVIVMKSQKAKCGIAVKCERPRPIAPSAPFKKTPQGVFFIAY